jgi:hypothetical protein
VLAAVVAVNRGSSLTTAAPINSSSVLHVCLNEVRRADGRKIDSLPASAEYQTVATYPKFDLAGGQTLVARMKLWRAPRRCLLLLLSVVFCSSQGRCHILVVCAAAEEQGAPSPGHDRGTDRWREVLWWIGPTTRMAFSI